MPVHLLAYKADAAYDVAVGTTGCTTPCTVVLAPGPATLHAKGTGTINLQLVVPTKPGQIRLQHTESGGFIAGAVLVPTGIVVGASMWAIGLACIDSGGCFAANVITWPVIGASMLITGIALLARGRVSAPPDANRIELVGRSGEPLLRFTSAGLAPLAGGKGANAGVRFEF